MLSKWMCRRCKLGSHVVHHCNGWEFAEGHNRLRIKRGLIFLLQNCKQKCYVLTKWCSWLVRICRVTTQLETLICTLNVKWVFHYYLNVKINNNIPSRTQTTGHAFACTFYSHSLFINTVVSWLLNNQLMCKPFKGTLIVDMLIFLKICSCYRNAVRLSEYVEVYM